MGGLTCVEIGGSGCQLVTFDRRPDGAERCSVAAERTGWGDALAGLEGPVALAVPGTIEDGRVTAVNLGWVEADPADALGLVEAPAVVLNDAAAAVLGESYLRGGAPTVYVGLGTGVGGAIARNGEVVADNLFGHDGGFGDHPCPCGAVGCLEALLGARALPANLDRDAVIWAAGLLARAVRPVARAGDVVVLGGGVARRNPALVTAVAAALPDRRVEPSWAPAGAKSAAPWGLRSAFVVDDRGEYVLGSSLSAPPRSLSTSARGRSRQ